LAEQLIIKRKLVNNASNNNKNANINTNTTDFTIKIPTTNNDETIITTKNQIAGSFIETKKKRDF